MANSRSALCILIVGLSLPMAAQSGESGPCGQIVAVCSSAGFVEHDAKQGYGLYKDCVDPIMRGSGQPTKAVRPLPPVSPNLIAACRTQNPNFGQGRRAR